MSKKMSLEEIKQFPIISNKLQVNFDMHKLNTSYSIISYHSNNTKDYDLSYEKLSDLDFLSVVGIKDYYAQYRAYINKYFILCKKEQACKILTSLKNYTNLIAKIDDLSTYSNKQQQRIIASLAINSLGKKKRQNFMYHNSSLFITANDNYNCDKKRFLVCLKIIVDNDVNIIAQTKTFSHPRSQKDLIDAQYIFQKGQYLGDEQWSATALKPVIIKKNVKYNYDQLPLDSVYILKNYTANKNTVPYWVFDPKLYKNGKLFIYHHVLDLVNKSFKDLICLSFTHYTLIDYTEFLPQKDLLKLIEKSLKDFKLGFLDPFDTKYSRLFIQGLQKQINTFVPSITYCDYPNCDLLINLCEPKQSKDNEENSEISYYAKGKTRKQFSHLALQHIEFDIEALKDYSTDKEQKNLSLLRGAY